MGVDRHATIQTAQTFASRGQLDKAIAEWKKLLTDPTADAAVHNSIGDLQLKRNAPREAMEAYVQAAKAFRSQGEPLKAIAAYKKVLKLDSSRAEIYRRLGDLNAERGLTSSAVAEYTTLAKLYLKAGKTKEALDVFGIIIRQDASNVIAQKQIVELCRELSLNIDQFMSGLSNPATGGSLPASGASAPPAFTEQPETSDRGNALSQAVQLMDASEYATADGILAQLLNQQPGDPEVCRLLARLHLKRGDSSVALNEYQFLAGAALRADDLDLAESLVKEYLEVDASCAPLLEIHGMIFEKRGEAETAALHYGKALQVVIEHPDPDMPTLPEELYSKIKELDPSSFLVSQLAPAFEAQPAAEPPEVVLAEETPVHAAEPVPPAPQAETPTETTAHTSSDTTGVESPADDDLELHYKLGTAYKDMGLLNEAIEEFRQSVAGPNLFLDSCINLARCLRERGMTSRAVACLEHALGDPRCTDDRSVALRYELGLLYEAEGLFDGALRTYETIPTFQDVAKRIEWIKGGAPREAPQPAAGETPVGVGKAMGDVPAHGRKKRRISYL